MNQRLLLSILSVAFAAMAEPAIAQSTWNGSEDGLWSNPDNWTGSAPDGSGVLVFNPASLTGASLLSTDNDLTGFTATGITFNNSTAVGSFALAGNQITLGGNIETAGATGTSAQLISLGLVLNGDRTVTTVANNSLTIAGVIGETGAVRNLIKTGNGLLRLEAANTFSGQVQVNQGALVITQFADVGTASSLGTGGGTSIIRLGNGGQTGTLRYEGAVAASTNRQIQVGNGNGAGATGGASVANTGTEPLVFTAPTFNAANATATAARILTLGGANIVANEVQGAIQDNSPTAAVGLTKADAGTWRLSSLASTYTGLTAVNQGRLEILKLADAGTASSIGAGATIRIGNAGQTGVLAYLGAGDSSDRQIQIGNGATQAGGATIESLGAGAIMFTNPAFNLADTTTGARILTLGGSNAGDNRIDGVISDNSDGTIGLTKAGVGRWSLAGANTYSGQVQVNQGILAVSIIADTGAASGLGSGSSNSLIRVGNANQSGALRYEGAVPASTDRQVQVGNGNASGNGGGATVANFGGGSLLFSAAIFNLANETAAAARTLTLDGDNAGANEIQGAIQDNNFIGGGVLNLTKTGTGSWVLSSVASSYSGLTAVNQGTLAVSKLADIGEVSSIGSGSTNPLIRIGNAGQTGALVYLGNGDSTGRQIQIGNGTGGGNSGGATILNNGTGALVFTSAQFNSVATAATGRTLALGGSNTNNNRVVGVVADNDGGSISLAKTGDGLWILEGANTFSGSTTVEEGTLRVASTSAIGTGALLLRQGTLELFNSAQSVGGITLGNATAGNGPASLILASDTALTPGGNIIYVADDDTANAATISGGEIVLSANRNFNVASNPLLTGPELLVSSVITETGGARNLTKIGAGTLLLKGANTYTGATNIQNGVLRLGTGGAISTGGLVFNGGATAGTLDLAGNTQAVAAVTLGAGTTSVAGLQHAVVDSEGGGVLSLGGNLTYNAGSAGFENGKATISVEIDLGGGTRTFTVNDSPETGVDLEISGVVKGTAIFAKAGAGTLLLSAKNEFAGQFRIDNGTVEAHWLDDAGEASSLGTGAETATIRIGNAANDGVLRFVGSGGSTDRQIQIGSGTGATHAGGATILNDGTGEIRFTAANFNAAVNTGTSDPGGAGRVLTLGGSNIGDNVIEGVLRNNNQTNNPSVHLVKDGVGTWVLEGANLYTGTTEVKAGTLRIDGHQSAATGNVTVESGATLGGTGTVGGNTTIRDGGYLTGGTDGGLGTLAFSGGLTLESGAFWLVDLVANADGSSDRINVGGPLDLGGASLILAPQQDFTPGFVYTIAQYGTLSGTFNGLGEGDVIGGQYQIAYGSESSPYITLTAVPEPAALAPLLTLLLLRLRSARRRGLRVLSGRAA